MNQKKLKNHCNQISVNNRSLAHLLDLRVPRHVGFIVSRIPYQQVHPASQINALREAAASASVMTRKTTAQPIRSRW
jgi:acetolactate synthase regulatory subunit